MVYFQQQIASFNCWMCNLFNNDSHLQRKLARNVGAYVSTLITMLAVEYKDKVYNGKWDWKDINARMLYGNTALIVYLVITII